MKIAARAPGLVFHIASIHCAALLLPRSHRAEWIKEWTSELWYVYKDSVSPGLEGWRGHVTVLAFCRGAFTDARGVRQQTGSVAPSRAPHAHSAGLCLFLLGGLAVLGAVLSLSLPSVRTILEAFPYRDTQSLVMISREGFAEAASPTISIEQYRLWRARPQHLFAELALYQPATQLIPLNGRNSTAAQVASVTSNFFPLLGVGLPFAATPSLTKGTLPALLISESLWRTAFKRDPMIFGKVIEIGNRRVTIAGVLKDNLWRFPHKADAWLIELDENATGLSSKSKGMIIARVASGGEAAGLGKSWHMTVPDRGDTDGDDGNHASDAGEYECVSLSIEERRPLQIYVFTVLLAFLSLPATTSIPLGDYPPSDKDLRWTMRMRRWGFLAGKIMLLLPIVFFFSLDLAHVFNWNNPIHADYLQIVSSFCICLFGLRWALRDQRSRCPVCLSKLTHPAHVGESSRNFLSWNGTELICVDGHGLMHVPGMPTCWFPIQRWTNLDPSWSSLFVTST